MKKVTVILILFFAAQLSSAQSFKVTAKTDSLEYLIGDFIRYEIITEAPSNCEVFVPPFTDSLKQLVFIRKEKSSETKNGDEIKRVFRYILAGYDSLDAEIPSIPVVLKNKDNNKFDTVYTNKVKLFVNKVKTDPQKEIKDIKNILRLPYDWFFFAEMIFALLALIALAYFLYKKYLAKRKNAETERKTVKIDLPPHKIAYKKLSELESEKLWQNGKVKEYHSRLTEIIREYFEKRFGFNSLEMTSAETLTELRKHNVKSDAIEITSEFLSNADKVKFAKYRPEPQVNDEMMKEAYKIVDLTKLTENDESSDV